MVTRAVRQKAPAVVVEEPGRPKMVGYLFRRSSNLLPEGLVSGFEAEDVATKDATEADLEPAARTAESDPGGAKS